MVGKNTPNGKKTTGQSSIDLGREETVYGGEVRGGSNQEPQTKREKNGLVHEPEGSIKKSTCTIEIRKREGNSQLGGGGHYQDYVERFAGARRPCAS